MAEKEVKSLNLIKAQSQVWDHLIQIKDSNQIGGAYLFSGPSGSGKEGLAIKFSQLLNCEKRGPAARRMVADMEICRQQAAEQRALAAAQEASPSFV